MHCVHNWYTTTAIGYIRWVLRAIYKTNQYTMKHMWNCYGYEVGTPYITMYEMCVGLYECVDLIPTKSAERCDEEDSVVIQ